MVIKTEIQLKLTEFRKSLGLNQTQFAESIEMSQGAIANMESGKRDVSKSMLLKIREVYGVDLYSFGEVNKTTIEASNIVPVPLWHVKASAGSGEALPDYPEKDVMWFDSRWLKNVLGVNNPSNLAIIQAKGNSMDGGKEPIKDGDLLMVDESYKEPIHNQVFVVNLGNNDIVVKRISRHWDGSLSLESDNPEYPFIIPNKEATVIGKVVWNGNKIGIS